MPRNILTHCQNSEGTCEFDHPQVCPLFEQWGDSKWGCKDRRCKLLHRNCCRDWMREGHCFRRDNNTCRYFHPYRMKQERSSWYPQEKGQEDRYQRSNGYQAEKEQEGRYQRSNGYQRERYMNNEWDMERRPIQRNAWEDRRGQDNQRENFLGPRLQEMQELIQGLRQEFNLVIQGQRQGAQGQHHPPGFQVQGMQGQGVACQPTMT